VISWLMRKAAADRPPDLMTAVRALEEVAGIAPTTIGDTGSVIVPPIIGTTTAAGSLNSRLEMTTGAPAQLAMPRRSKMLPVAIAVLIAGGAGGAIYVATRGAKDPDIGSGSGPLVHVPDAAAVSPTPDAAMVDPDATGPVVDAASRMVTITITGAPDGSPVKIGGEVVGTTPKVQIPGGSKTDPVYLVIAADGFHPFTLPVTPDHDDTRPVKLKPARGRPPGTGIGTGTGTGTGTGINDPTNDIPDKKTGKTSP
jgi:hypothetical protein